MEAAPGAAPCDEHRRASLSGRLADTGKPEVTADDLDARDGAPSDPSDVREYKPKPPLWRPDTERRRSTLTIVLTALSVALGAALLTISCLSGCFSIPPDVGVSRQGPIAEGPWRPGCDGRV